MFAWRKFFRVFGITALSGAAVLFLLVVAVYLPPVQRWAVGRVSAMLEEKMGVRVEVDRVRLTPFLNLDVQGMRAFDAVRDTLVAARRVHLDVAFLPLFEGRADIDAVALDSASIDSKGFIPDVAVRGTVRRLETASHGVEWTRERAVIDRVQLDGARLSVALSDTAAKDTSTTPVKWVVDVGQLRVHDSDVRLSLPGDSIHVQAGMGDATLRDGHFDLGRSRYTVRSLHVAEGRTSLNMTRRALPTDALFDIAGLNLDLAAVSYDEHRRLHAELNHAAALEKLRNLRITELRGSLDLDTLTLRLPDLLVASPRSRIVGSLSADLAAFRPDGRGTLHTRVSARLSRRDLLAAVGRNVSKKTRDLFDEMSHRLLENDDLSLAFEASGNLRNLSIERTAIEVPGLVRVNADGMLRRISETRRSGHLNLTVSSASSARFRNFLPRETRATIDIPDGLRMLASLNFAGDEYRTHFALHQGSGQIFGRADVNLATERYAADVDVRRFPVAHFAKTLALGPLTGSLGAEGKGFDADALRANLKATAHIVEGSYDRFSLAGLRLSGALRGGNAVVDFQARNPLVEGEGRVTAQLNRRYAAQMDVRLERVDLLHLGAIDDTLTLGGNFRGTVEASQDFRHLGARGEMTNLRFVAPTRRLLARDINLDLLSHPDTVAAHIASGDFFLDFTAKTGLQGLMRHAQRIAETAQRQIEHRSIDQHALKRELPTATMRLHAGTENLLTRYLRYKTYGLRTLDVYLDANPRDGLNGNAQLGRLQSGAFVIDTVYGALRHGEDGLEFTAHVKNSPTENPNPFSASFSSHLLPAGLQARVSFKDATGKTGLRLEAQVEMQDGGTRVHLDADTTVVAYRNFAINADNYLMIGKNERISADIKLLADDGTGLQVYSEGGDSLRNDITVSVHRLNLGELANVLPYLPKIGGTLDGDFHLIGNRTDIAAVGAMNAKDFAYEGTTIGTLGAEFVYQPDKDGQHSANAYLTLDGKEVAEMAGNYDPRGKGDFDGKLALRALPLSIADAFLNETGFAMRGVVSGELTIQGEPSRPKIDGEITTKEAHLYSNLYGMDFTLDPRPLKVERSQIALDNYALTTTDHVPLTLSGKVDLAELTSPFIEMNVLARNFPVVNTKRKNESLLYGKLLADLTADVRGTTDRLSVTGRFTVLDKTNLTYVMTNTPLTAGSDLNDLVTFTDFADTLTAIAPQESERKSNMNLRMEVEVNKGARFHCYLTPNGDSYVDATGEGRLTLRMLPQGDMRLTGRLTIDEGKMNYELPVIPLRTFNFAAGSSVDFTGDMMNPTLDITATERVKTIVTENERQRAVTFDAGVKISKTVKDMGLEFIIDAPEDLTIKNQLTAMNKEERGKAAVALLATGMYITDDNLSTGGLRASNALNAFLQSEIQNIAGKALSTIDLSFGMESGVNAGGETTTDYSFQFSKRFLNDRMRVVIGGKVSSGADAAEATQSFIDNVAIEYRLDPANTRYVRLFYDRNSRDPLEGTLMKTGAGFVMRRKTDRLGDLFIFRRKKKAAQSTPSDHPERP